MMIQLMGSERSVFENISRLQNHDSLTSQKKWKNFVVSLPVGWNVDNFESADMCCSCWNWKKTKKTKHNETKYSLSFALSVFFNSEAGGMWSGMWRNKRQSTLFSLDGTLGLTKKFEACQFFLLLQKPQICDQFISLSGQFQAKTTNFFKTSLSTPSLCVISCHVPTSRLLYLTPPSWPFSCLITFCLLLILSRVNA